MSIILEKGVIKIKNTEIRSIAKKYSVYLYEVAERLKINDGNFSRKLRKELSETEKEKILNIIKQIVKERT